MSTLFFLLAVLSPIGYSVQGTMLSGFGRQLNVWTVLWWRHVSFFVTFLPFLWWASWGDWQGFLADPRALLAYSGSLFTAIVSQYCGYMGVRSIPVSLGVTLKRGLGALCMIGLGALLFDEFLRWPQWLMVGVILLGVGTLVLRKEDFAHLDDQFWVGVSYAVGSASLAALSFALIGEVVKRGHSPYLVAYIWECGMLLPLAVVLLGRWAMGQAPLAPTTTQQKLQIGGWASWTLLGTGAYIIAASLGPVSVLGAIANLSIVSSTLISWWLYGERLSLRSLIAMAIVVAGVIGLKFL